MGVLNVLMNILWIVLGGEILFLFYCLGGVLFMLTIIGFPFGVEAIKLGGLALLPFGAEVGSREGVDGLRFFCNIIWFVLFGWIIALMHVLLAVIFAITIIGLPFAYQHWKLAFVGAFPFGKLILHW
ncbi:hypothetical protein DFS34DRAFT_633577 [Phlyctochytrium arcticum]|nr:hypothetical protein DFS34DRAFT_633577 [Phlyctochytrium arcticum]